MLVYKPFQFVNKAEVISSSKNHLHTPIAVKKTLSLFWVSAVLCSPTQSAVQIKQFFQLGSIFSWNPQKKEKANQKLYVN